MKKIVIGIMGTISGLVMLFSYPTSTQSIAASATGDTGSGSTQSDPDTGTGGTAEASSFTGDAVETRWGTVQVEITVENGRITSSDAIQYPSESRKDQQINAYAVPILNAAVVEAQSADIDAVSGATVTSGGYVESLQSAIDAANLG